MPVHPVGRVLHRTIITALHHRYRRPDDPAKDVIPRLVHRLDLETSGVLLVGKDEKVTADLARQFRSRGNLKEYLAVVRGRPDPASGSIELPLGPDEASRVPYKQAVRLADGKPSRTDYEVLESGNECSLVRLVLHTGRKHQLRVHLAALGHHIVGDKIYGPDEKYYFKAREGPPDEEDLKVLGLPRQALHAHRLTLRHPISGEEISFEAPCPEAFLGLIND